MAHHLAIVSKNILLEAAELMENCFTLVNMGQPDQPFIYVNQPFMTMTAYRPEDVLHKNPRLLQGKLTSGETKAKIRQALAHKEAIYQDIVNYTKDGRPFWDRMILLPIELRGEGLHYIGIQCDVTAKKIAQGFSFERASMSEVKDMEIRDRIFNPLASLVLAKGYLNNEQDKGERETLIKKIKQIVEKLAASANEMDKP